MKQLPNGLHFEWTAKALLAGKHVLLEKPSTDTEEETRKLFEIADAKGLVLLEAFHSRCVEKSLKFLTCC
jgi:predicted dehydrogenase